MRAAKVRLTTSDGQERGERVLAYEGTFSFEELLPGGYLLTLDREDEAMIGRASGDQELSGFESGFPGNHFEQRVGFSP